MKQYTNQETLGDLRLRQMALYEQLLHLLRLEEADIAEKQWERLQAHRAQESFFIERLESLHRVIEARLRDFPGEAALPDQMQLREESEKRRNAVLAVFGGIRNAMISWYGATGREIDNLKNRKRFRPSSFRDPSAGRLDISY